MAALRMHEHEELRFRHAAQHNKRDGMLSITNVRLLWEAYAGDSKLELPWASIDSCKYSPESHHSAVLRVVHTQAPKPAMFTLVGGNQAQNYAALQECKQRIVEITSARNSVAQAPETGLPNNAASVSTSAAAATAPLPGTTEWKSQQMSQRKRSRIEAALDGAMTSVASAPSGNDLTIDSSVQRQRASLLQADRQLRQKYDELVASGIVPEEEFWSNQRVASRNWGRGDGTAGEAQGQTSTMWVDVLAQHMKKDKDGSDQITLTGEAIHQIFTLYPAVRRAHQEKVPLELTEEQFWRRLLESEYYNRNILARPSADSSSMLTDDMFAKYARNDDVKTDDLDAQHKRVHVHYLDVDLTATMQDHIQHAQLEVEEDLPGSKGREREQRIIKKYNKHSKEVLKSQQVTKLLPEAAATEGDLPMAELEALEAPHYVLLHIRNVMADTSVTFAPETVGHKLTWSMGELSSSLGSCFPSAVIAKMILTTDTQRMAAVTEASHAAVEAAAAGSEGRATLHSNGDNHGHGGQQQQRDQLPQSFINSHRQRYEMQAELLRHFYSAERHFDRQPQAKERGKKIVDKLQNELHVMTEMKRQLRDKENAHKEERFLQAMMDQLHRALDVWERAVGESY